MENLRGVIGLCLVVEVFFFWIKDRSQIQLFASLAILFPFCCPLLISLWRRLPHQKTGVKFVALLGVLMLFVAIDAKAETDGEKEDLLLAKFFPSRQLGVETPEQRALEKLAEKVSREECPCLRSGESEAVEDFIKEAFDSTGKMKVDWAEEVRHRVEESNPDASCMLRSSTVGVAIFTVTLGSKNREFVFSQRKGFMCEEINHARKEARR